MMDDFLEFSDEQESKRLLERFQRMLQNGDRYFFDSEEYEDIIDYCFNHRKIKLAGKIIKVAIEQYPDNIELLIRQAHYLMRINKTTKALDLLLHLQKHDPFNSDINIAKAYLYNKQRKYTDEIREYKEAIKNSDAQMEDISAIYTNIAGAYMQLQDFGNSILYLQKNLEVDPENDVIFAELGTLYEVTNRTEEALDFFQKFVDKQPYNFYAWQTLGHVYKSLGLYEKAIDAYEFCQAINPKNPDAYHFKSMTLFLMEKYEEAILELDEEIGIEMYSPEAFVLKGNCYQKLNKYKLALKNYKIGVELDETTPEGFYGLATTYYYLKHYKSAYNAAKKAIKNNPDILDNILLLALCQKELGLIQDAEISYKTAVKLYPLDASSWLKFSELYADLALFDIAFAVVDKGFSAGPQNVELLIRGVAYTYYMGNPKEAIANLQWALTIPGSSIESLIEYAPDLLNDPDIQELANRH